MRKRKKSVRIKDILEKDGQLKEKRQTNNQKLKIKDNHPSLLKKKNHAT